jgi:tRNA(fMet)-specific endonuclease VapC
MRSVPSDSLATSSVCVLELRYGAARHPQGSALWERISREVLPLVDILPLGSSEAERAGDLIAFLEAQGRVIGIEDALIGATGLVHQRTMVTRNVEHFARIEGLIVENWWD